MLLNSKCYVCQKELVPSNASQEHIIPNAIGGRLKSSKLLCQDCNKDLGKSADAELTKQLSFYASILLIERDRGKIQPIKGLKNKSGEKFDIINGRTPVISDPSVNIEMQDGGISLSVSAKDEKNLQQIFKGIKNKYPTFDLEASLNQVIRTNYYLDEPLQINQSIGGEPAIQSICKTALNAYLVNGGEREHVKHLIPYLLGNENRRAVTLYSIDNITYEEGDDITHSIYIKGDKQENILYSTIEYFSAFSFIIILNDSYNGENFDFSYCYSVISNSVLDKKSSLKFNRNKLFEMFTNNNLFDFNNMTNKVSRILKISNKKHTDIIIKEIINESIKEVFKDLLEGAVFTEDLLSKLSNSVAQKYAPFLIHINKKRK